LAVLGSPRALLDSLFKVTLTGSVFAGRSGAGGGGGGGALLLAARRAVLLVAVMAEREVV